MIKPTWKHAYSMTLRGKGKKSVPNNPSSTRTTKLSFSRCDTQGFRLYTFQRGRTGLRRQGSRMKFDISLSRVRQVSCWYNNLTSKQVDESKSLRFYITAGWMQYTKATAHLCSSTQISLKGLQRGTVMKGKRLHSQHHCSCNIFCVGKFWKVMLSSKIVFVYKHSQPRSPRLAADSNAPTCNIDIFESWS